MSATASRLAHAVTRLRDHPQDHGWRQFFSAVDLLLQAESAPLLRILAACRAERPAVSGSHVFTLLGMTMKMVAHDEMREGWIFRGSAATLEYAQTLEGMLAEHESLIARTMLTRQNSFTGVRRFLLPQVIFARYFARLRAGAVNLLDVGTGLGIMPRQINSQENFDLFSTDLRWPVGIPEYQPVPIGKRFGVDRAPLPDLEWVRHCYGPSSYYDRMFEELLSVLAMPEVANREVQVLEMDILETGRLGALIREQRIHAVTCSFVLYQYEQSVRNFVIEAIVENLPDPGLLISMEPRDDLEKQGCNVRLYRSGDHRPVRFAAVSDSHFVGRVLPHEHYDRFTSDYL